MLADNRYLPTAINKLLQFCMSWGVHFQNYVRWLSWSSAASPPPHTFPLFILLLYFHCFGQPFHNFKFYLSPVSIKIVAIGWFPGREKGLVDIVSWCDFMGIGMKLSGGQPQLLVGMWAVGSLVPDLSGIHIAGKGLSQNSWCLIIKSLLLNIIRSPLAMLLEEK